MTALGLLVMLTACGLSTENTAKEQGNEDEIAQELSEEERLYASLADEERYEEYFLSDCDGMIYSNTSFTSNAYCYHSIYVDGTISEAYSPSFYININDFTQAMDEKMQGIEANDGDREMYIMWNGQKGSLYIEPIKNLDSFENIERIYAEGNWADYDMIDLKQVECGDYDAYSWKYYKLNDNQLYIIVRNKNNSFMVHASRDNERFYYSQEYEDTVTYEFADGDEYEQALIRGILTMDIYDEFQDTAYIIDGNYTNKGDRAYVLESPWDGEIFYYFAETISNINEFDNPNRDASLFCKEGYRREYIKKWYDNNILTGDRKDVIGRLYENREGWFKKFGGYFDRFIVDPYEKRHEEYGY